MTTYTVPIRKIALLAAKAEEGGIAYYRKIGGLVRDEQIKQFCQFFAEQEKEHKEFFEKVAADTNPEVKGLFSVDVVGLLNQGIHRLSSTGFQSPDFDYGKMDIDQALELALRLELETVAIYEKIRQAMDRNYNVALYKIIHEEDKHVQTIENVINKRHPERKKPPQAAKIVRDDKIVIQKRRVLPGMQEYMMAAVIILCFIGLILAMVGPKTIGTVVQSIVGQQDMSEE